MRFIQLTTAKSNALFWIDPARIVMAERVSGDAPPSTSFTSLYVETGAFLNVQETPEEIIKEAERSSL